MSRIMVLSHTDIKTDSRILKQIGSLRAAGINVVAVGVDKVDAGSLPEKMYNLVSLRLAARRFVWLHAFIKNTAAFVELFFRLIFIVVRVKPVIVHCHDYYLLPVAVLSKFLVGSKIIYDAHELESDRNGIGRLHGTFIYFFERIHLPSVTRMITVSPSIADWYQHKFKIPRPAVVMNCPVISPEAKSEDFDLRVRYSIPADSKVFVYVGMIAPGRNIEELISTFKSSEQYLVFIGRGSLLEDVIDATKLHNNIRYYGYVAHKELSSVLRSADFGICLIPNVSLSDYYSLPNKLFEYLASGLPVLVSDFPDIRDLVFNGGAEVGVVASANFDDVSAAVDKLIRDEFVFTRNCQGLVAVSWASQAEVLIQLYNEVSY